MIISDAAWDLGRHLRLLRQIKRVTLGRLCARGTGLDLTEVYEVEHGIRVPRRRWVVWYLDAAGWPKRTDIWSWTMWLWRAATATIGENQRVKKWRNASKLDVRQSAHSH